MKPGDLVTLKSGGPRMTVAHVAAADGRAVALCMWFAGDHLNAVPVPLSALTNLRPERN